MPLADVEAIDILWVALSVSLGFVSVGLLYALIRLGGTLGRLTSFIRGLEAELVPLINKVGGTVDRLNAQLDKVDRVTDSAVDAADAVDTAVRAITLAITRPVQKISGFVAGVRHGAADFRAHLDWRSAFQGAREAARRRERDIAEELGRDDLGR